MFIQLEAAHWQDQLEADGVTLMFYFSVIEACHPYKGMDRFNVRVFVSRTQLSNWAPELVRYGDFGSVGYNETLERVLLVMVEDEINEALMWEAEIPKKLGIGELNGPHAFDTRLLRLTNITDFSIEFDCPN